MVTVSKHTQASSPDFFSDDKIKPEVREVLLDIADDVLDSLSEHGLDIDPEFIVLTGSLTGEDYDEFSDIDLHIGYNPSDYGEHTKAALTYASKAFNLDPYDLAGRKIELYFQAADEPHKSPGVYDLVNDTWISAPSDAPEDIPSDFQVDKMIAKLTSIIARFQRKYYSNLDKEQLGSLLEDIDAFRDQLKEYRNKGLQSDFGIYSLENSVFKGLRRNNALDRLSRLRHRVQDAMYEVLT